MAVLTMRHQIKEAMDRKDRAEMQGYGDIAGLRRPGGGAGPGMGGVGSAGAGFDAFRQRRREGWSQ